MAKITVGDAISPDEKTQLEHVRLYALNRKRNFPNFIDSYIEYCSRQESTNRIRRWVAVSVVASALGRKVWLDAGQFTTYPNFYIIILGESGLIHKSTTTRIGVELLEKLDDIKLMSQRVTDRSIIDQLQRARSEFFYNGRSYVQSSAFCYSSELITFMREVSGSIAELLTDFWDCPPLWTYETKKDGEIRIEAPCLNILGASTPTWLQKAIPTEELEGGLASRIIFVHEPNGPDICSPWGPQKDEATKLKLIEDLKQINAIIGPFSYTKEAKSFYESWYVEQKKKIAEIPDVRLRGFYARKPVTLWKLAMIFAVSENNNRIFDLHHLERAIEYISEIEETLISAFGSAGQNKLSRGLHQILEFLKVRGAIPHQAIMKMLIRDYNGTEIEQIMKDLQRMEGVQTRALNGTITYIFKEVAKK